MSKVDAKEKFVVKEQFIHKGVIYKLGKEVPDSFAKDKKVLPFLKRELIDDKKEDVKKDDKKKKDK